MSLVTEFKPFQFEGGLVSGGLIVSSMEDWVHKVVTPYADKLKSPDLPLEAVWVANNSRGLPVFTLHESKGMRLKTWSDVEGVGLVIAL